MPIYEYRCESCGHQLDALQKVSDPHLTDCPSCSQSALRRMISAPRFRLKGSGWYETDFKKDGKRNLADTGGDGKPADKGGNDSKQPAGGDGAAAKADAPAKGSSSEAAA